MSAAGSWAARSMRAAPRPGIARTPSARRRAPSRDGVMGCPGRPPGNSHGLVLGEPVPVWDRPVRIRSVRMRPRLWRSPSHGIFGPPSTRAHPARAEPLPAQSIKQPQLDLHSRLHNLGIYRVKASGRQPPHQALVMRKSLDGAEHQGASNIGMPQSAVDGVTFGTWKGWPPRSYSLRSCSASCSWLGTAFTYSRNACRSDRRSRPGSR